MKKESVTIVLVLFCAAIGIDAGIVSRILHGYTAQNPRDFPFFVHIVVTPKSGANRPCAGSLLDDRWVLTSLNCVVNMDRAKLYFGLYQLNATATATQMDVKADTVVPFPTNADDLSLILLPTKLKLSPTIQPIKIARTPPNSALVLVSAGFATATVPLYYGFLRLQNATACSSYPDFDAFKQFCTIGWINPYQRPCSGDDGSGLVTNWPKDPQLIGVFAKPLGCGGATPEVYTNVAKYYYWIESYLRNIPAGKNETD